MAWTTPRRVVTGDLITAADWNTNIVDNLNELKKEIKKEDPTPLQAESNVLAVGALALAASATSREVTRRGFLGLGWFRRR